MTRSRWPEKTECPQPKILGRGHCATLRPHEDQTDARFTVRALNSAEARLSYRQGAGPSRPSRDRLLLRLSGNVQLMPMGALEALRIPDVELPVDKYVAPTPGTGLEFPYDHFLTPYGTPGVPAVLESGDSRTPLAECHRDLLLCGDLPKSPGPAVVSNTGYAHRFRPSRMLYRDSRYTALYPGDLATQLSHTPDWLVRSQKATILTQRDNICSVRQCCRDVTRGHRHEPHGGRIPRPPPFRVLP